MKINIKMKLITMITITIVILNCLFNLYSYANIKKDDIINLIGDHECDSLVEYWMEDYQKWSYKIVWFVNYFDSKTNEKYPAFCVEPAKQGVGTGYDSYDVIIDNEIDDKIWRILNKGYMGSDYVQWKLECDDDLYSATKIALHSLSEGIPPKDKYILGNRSVDGNAVEEIRRRGEKVLEVAQNLYDYGVNGKEIYEKPQINISKYGNETIKNIDNNLYYIQKYYIETNKPLKSYEVEIENFPEGTKILNLENQEQNILSENYFKIAIPINKITKDIEGNIKIKNALIKTNPIYYCKSTIKDAQSYVTYNTQYEKQETNIKLNIQANNCSLTIKKIDNQTKEGIEGVIFEIFDQNNKILFKQTTDKEGMITLKNILPSNYKIKETKAEKGYILSNEEKIINLIWGKDEEVIVENKKIKGKIKILKISEDDNQINGKQKGAPIQDVIFEIKNNRGEIIEKCITNEEGIAVTKELEMGKYYIKEIKTDEDYILNEKEFSIEILENNKIYEITVENKSKEIETEPQITKLPKTGF